MLSGLFGNPNREVHIWKSVVQEYVKIKDKSLASLIYGAVVTVRKT